MAKSASVQFFDLFRGRTDAIGLNRGGVERREVRSKDYLRHFSGIEGCAIGIFPLLDDNTVWFGAIDLDEPDFELAANMQFLIPAPSFIERSRSGNAHVWVFFERPAPAWAVRTVLRGATEAAGRPDVEIFPKQDQLKPGMVGNYINLPLFGDERPILSLAHALGPDHYPARQRDSFLREAIEQRHDPAVWERRARALGGVPPAEREATREFGTSATLHECADYIIVNRESNPLRVGHRAVVLFSLAKMLANWSEGGEDVARKWVSAVNEAGEKPVPQFEIERIIENVMSGQFTSTGCDDPLVQPYVSPDCRIAHG